jgi:hypothetical protein
VLVTLLIVSFSCHGAVYLRHFHTAEHVEPSAHVNCRVADKLIFSLIIFSLFWGIGNDLTPTNLPNIAACLFM